MKYQELVDVYSALEATTKRLEKTEIIAEYLKKLEKAVSVGKMNCTYHEIMCYQEVVAMQLLQ